jgi:hypothetical protein
MGMPLAAAAPLAGAGATRLLGGAATPTPMDFALFKMGMFKTRKRLYDIFAALNTIREQVTRPVDKKPMVVEVKQEVTINFPKGWKSWKDRMKERNMAA